MDQYTHARRTLVRSCSATKQRNAPHPRVTHGGRYCATSLVLHFLATACHCDSMHVSMHSMCVLAYMRRDAHAYWHNTPVKASSHSVCVCHQRQRTRTTRKHTGASLTIARSTYQAAKSSQASDDSHMVQCASVARRATKHQRNVDRAHDAKQRKHQAKDTHNTHT